MSDGSQMFHRMPLLAIFGAVVSLFPRVYRTTAPFGRVVAPLILIDMRAVRHHLVSEMFDRFALRSDLGHRFDADVQVHGGVVFGHGLVRLLRLDAFGRQGHI